VTVQKVAAGIYWVEIPQADIRILCGCPADCVKHLARAGLIRTVEKDGVRFETGPNVILLSDASIQNGAVSNLAEFPVLQMLYKQGMIVPGHPNNTGRRPILLGLGDQVRSQGEYLFRGNYGLASREELEAAGAPPDQAQEMLRVKRWFAFGRIQRTEELVDLRPLDGDAVALAPGVVVHRLGFNRYQIIAFGGSAEVDLSPAPGEWYEPPYALPVGTVARERFSVVHIGEGDGWDPGRPCMASLVCSDGLLYLVDAGPNVTRSLAALGLDVSDIEGVFHTHAHDDHFAGLAALARSERRLAYYAAPWVRASVARKLVALMRIREPDLGRFFDVRDLLPGAWNPVGGMEVRPVWSPHPVETTVMFFRATSGGRTRTYAHLADIASKAVLARLSAPAEGGPPLSAASREVVERELFAAVDLKKVDAGGGMIHGEAADFADDGSDGVIFSHGAAQVPNDHGRIRRTPTFGEADVLIPGAMGEERVRVPVARIAAGVTVDAVAAGRPGWEERRAVLAASPLFSWIRSEHVLDRVADAMEEHPLRRGEVARLADRPALVVLAEGEVDLVMGAHLLETIHRGGVWGEASILEHGLSICEPHVATEGGCYAVPAAVVESIPGLFWRVQESFERRLHCFRTGFCFEWSESFRVAVPVLDEQHEKLFALANSLSMAIQESSSIAGHDAEKKALLDFTRTHFTDEERILLEHGYARLDVQAREHAELLSLLERFIDAGERRRRPRTTTAVDYLKDWLIRHTLLEDQLYRPFLEEARRR
jgi:hemerythrin-like metal-binding protein